MEDIWITLTVSPFALADRRPKGRVRIYKRSAHLRKNYFYYRYYNKPTSELVFNLINQSVTTCFSELASGAAG